MHAYTVKEHLRDVLRSASGADLAEGLAALIGIPYSYEAPESYVQVNVTGPEVFGPPGADVLQHLTAVADHLRTDWTQLPADLAEIDVHLERALGARSTVGSRYAQLETMRDRTDQDILLLRERLSEIEDIDLPATIVDLQLQETAYQAALSATARSVQPSLLDFLR